MENLLETFFMSDQPVVCPKCGSRTEFEEISNSETMGVIQIHQCFDEKCQYKFEMVES